MIKMFFIYDCFVSSKLDSKPNSVAKSCYNFSLDTITPYVGRDPEKPDSQGVDLDAFLENVHRLQQQQQLQ